MTVQQIKYVLAVAERGSFQRAAEDCFVTQPTLSQQIQKLEDELGVTLFDRSRHPIAPTHSGAVILKQMVNAYRELSQIEALVLETKGLIAGEFRLGIIPTLAPYLLPRFLQKFAKKYPAVTLFVEELQTDRIVESLALGKIDAGILVTPLDSPDVIESVLFYEPIHVYFSKDHPLLKHKDVSEKDLSTADLFLLSEGHCFRNQVLQLCHSRAKGGVAGGGGSGSGGGVRRQLQIESGSLETVKRLVDQGSGYTLIPELAVLDLVGRAEQKYVRDFKAPVPLREVSLVVNRHFLKEKLLGALKEEILSAIPTSLRERKGSRNAIIPIT